MKGVDILEKLELAKKKRAKSSDKVLMEVNRILSRDLYSEKNILSHLKNYNKLIELIDEDEVDHSLVFQSSEIREIALSYRLRFADTQAYKFEFPAEVIWRIEHLNSKYHKSLRGFKILSTTRFFKDEKCHDTALIFAPTSLGNYFLVHKWGKPLSGYRKLINWPLQNIENLFASLIFFTLAITFALPTHWITYDSKVTYWCVYRIGIFFHLFIFNMGVTAFITFSFSKNLSSNVWNSS